MEKRNGGKALDNGRTKKPRSVRNNAPMDKKQQARSDLISRNLRNATMKRNWLQQSEDDEDEQPIIFRSLRNATMDGRKEKRQDQGEEQKTLNVTVDLDTLECPLCFSPFQAPIFQCKNGHAACEACCVRIDGTCSSCHEPIGEIRCRPLEKAIATMFLPCAFAEHGCTRRRLRYAEKLVHEALLCHYAPCVCPLPGCGYAGLDLRDHIQLAHAGGGEHDDVVVSFAGSAAVTLRRSTPFVVLLQETDARVFLLLNGGNVPSGRSLSVVCVGPRLAGNKSLEYELKVCSGGRGRGGGGMTGALALSATGPVACTRMWAGHHPTEGFLFVPDAYWSSSGGVSVTVHVRKLNGDKA